ncbi:hypothetical protein BHE74_00015367 [Ensete ventricosum]|nr:hypothetical protein BHE74_00015367 [Ensete ventricosum]
MGIRRTDRVDFVCGAVLPLSQDSGDFYGQYFYYSFTKKNYSVVPVGFLQVGLVIGQLNRSSDRGFVYDLIPTPPTDGGGPACSLKSEAAGKDDKKKGSKSGKPSAELPASLVVDNDWVAEHARQVKMESFSMYAKKLIGSCCVTSYNGFLYLCF